MTKSFSLSIPFAFFLAAGAFAVHAQQSFQITSLSTSGASIIEHNAVTGDDRGGIALSSSNIFYTGDSATGRFSTGNLSSAANTGFQYDSLVSDLRTKQVYTLANGSGPLQFGGGVVSRLIPLDGSTGTPTAGEITLSTPITVNSAMTSAGIFSGWNRIVLLDGGSMQAYNIDLPSGVVTAVGLVNLPVDQGSPDDRCGCENWATWGIAEYAGGAIHLVYAATRLVSTFWEDRQPTSSVIL